MTDKNIEQLKNFAEVFKSAKIIPPEDMKKIFTGILGILANYKKETETLNTDTKRSTSALINKFSNEWSDFLGNIINSVDEKTGKNSKEFKKALKEVQALAEEVKKSVPKEGRPGKDADPEAISAEVYQKVMKNRDKLCDSPEDIATKLESLEGPDRLKAFAIDGIEELIKSLLPSNLGVQRIGVGGNRYLDKLANVNTRGKLVGDTLVWNGAEWIASTPSSGGGYETPTGAIDGVNLEFTVLNTPRSIVLNGSTYFENDGYTFNAGTLKITIAASIVPQTGSTLRSFY